MSLAVASASRPTECSIWCTGLTFFFRIVYRLENLVRAGAADLELAQIRSFNVDFSRFEEDESDALAVPVGKDANADNPYTRQFASLVRGKPYAFSRLHPVEEGAFLAEDGWLCMAEKGTVTRVMRSEDIRIAGAHNRENFLAAIAAVWGAVPTEAMRRFAREFTGIAHRCELARERGGVRWINDSIGTSPSRTIAGLEACLLYTSTF